MEEKVKFINKLSPKDRKLINTLIHNILNNDFTGLDVIKLQGEKQYFRVKKGSFRIIFFKGQDGLNKIETIGFRNEHTYRNF